MRHSSRPQRGLGIAVRLTREKKRLTQETVAERAGIAVPTLSHVEAGHANPTWATVSDVAAALDPDREAEAYTLAKAMLTGEDAFGMQFIEAFRAGKF